MKKLEIIPRIRINGVYYTMEDLPKEKTQEIVRQRIDTAFSGINYEKKAAG